MGKSDLLWRFLVRRSREHVPMGGRSHVSHSWLCSVPWQEGRAVPSAWGHPCGAELSCCSSCVTFEHNTQTALAGINCPQRAAVCVYNVSGSGGVLAHMKLIRAVEWCRTRTSFSPVNNLYPVFTASVSQAEVEAELCRAQQWDVGTQLCKG